MAFLFFQSKNSIKAAAKGWGVIKFTEWKILKTSEVKLFYFEVEILQADARSGKQ